MRLVLITWHTAVHQPFWREWRQFEVQARLRKQVIFLFSECVPFKAQKLQNNTNHPNPTEAKSTIYRMLGIRPGRALSVVFSLLLHNLELAFLFLFCFKFLLDLLVWHWLIRVYRVQAYMWWYMIFMLHCVLTTQSQIIFHHPVF